MGKPKKGNKGAGESSKRINTIRNKIRRLERHVLLHENDKSGLAALEKWQGS